MAGIIFLQAMVAHDHDDKNNKKGESKMIMEVYITLEVMAFLFMSMGIIPFNKRDNPNRYENLPLVNKILFFGIAAIVFFALALTSNAYDYNYCYINETVVDFSTNSTTSTATCAPYVIYNPEMSYLNLFFGVIAILLIIIVSIITSISKHERNFLED